LVESIKKELLLAKAVAKGMTGRGAARFLNELIADQELFVWRIKRSGTGPEIHIARYEQPPV
jgi:hypothetical protein